MPSGVPSLVTPNEAKIDLAHLKADIPKYAAATGFGWVNNHGMVALLCHITGGFHETTTIRYPVKTMALPRTT